MKILLKIVTFLIISFNSIHILKCDVEYSFEINVNTNPNQNGGKIGRLNLFKIL